MSVTTQNRTVHDLPAADRRSSCRMPQPGGQGTGKLHIGKKLIDVEILDESAGGFMIAGDGIPPTSPTRPVTLVTISGRHRAQVVWRRSASGKVRMGMQRLPDEVDYDDSPSWVIWMLVAIIVGLGLGYVIAFHHDGGFLARACELATGVRQQ